MTLKKICLLQLSLLEHIARLTQFRLIPASYQTTSYFLKLLKFWNTGLSVDFFKVSYKVLFKFTRSVTIFGLLLKKNLGQGGLQLKYIFIYMYFCLVHIQQQDFLKVHTNLKTTPRRKLWLIWILSPHGCKNRLVSKNGRFFATTSILGTLIKRRLFTSSKFRVNREGKSQNFQFIKLFM